MRALSATLICCLLLGATLPSKAPQLAVVYGATQTFMVDGITSTKHLLGVYYTTPQRAPTDATASVDLPAALLLGTDLALVINNADSARTRSTEVLRFWGPRAPGERGQPEVWHPPQAGYLVHVAEGSAGSPDPLSVAEVAATARLSGNYSFHVSYLGDTTLELGPQQEFLAPIVLTVPRTASEVDISSGATLRWNKVERAIGYAVSASGKNADGQQVIWEHAKDAALVAATEGSTAAVGQHLLLPAQLSHASIPPGLFRGMVTLTITAYSAEVLGSGAFPALGWSQSTMDVELGD